MSLDVHNAPSDAPASDPEATETPATPAPRPAPIESPPPSAQPARPAEPDPRARLNLLAAELMRNRNRRLLTEFLQLRRALR